MKTETMHHELRLSLNRVILGVSFGIIFFTVVNGPPLTGFIRALKANDFIYSVIMALPMLSSVIQVLAAYLFENSGYRKLSFLVSGFMRIIWIPIVFIPLIIPAKDYHTRIVLLTVLIAVYSIANSVTGVSFLSWMGDLVPSSIRGRFFSTRTMIFTMVGAVAGLLIGLFLDRLNDFVGFAILFSVAAIFGMIDIACFIWIKDPPRPPKAKSSLRELCMEPFQNQNYAKYLLFAAVWNFGINFVAPFFNVYMLENLGMKYFTVYILSQFVSNIATILFVRVWGRIADKYGSKPVLFICGTGMAMVSFLWCLATPGNYLLVIPLIHILAGFFWPGCDVTCTNLAIWLAPEKNRSAYIAMYTLAASLVGGGLAYICGGAFMELTGPFLAHLKLPFLFSQPFNNFHSLFLIAGTVRLIAIYVFMRKVTDGHFSTQKLFKDLSNQLKVKG
jgi:MFS family permease